MNQITRKILLILILIGPVWTVNSVALKMEDWIEIHAFTNANEYFVVDSIYFEDTLHILYDTETSHMFAIVGKENHDKLTNQNILQQSNAFLFLSDFIDSLMIVSPDCFSLFFMNEILKDWPEEGPYPEVITKGKNKMKGLLPCSYNKHRPTFYLLILIQGRFYNELTTGITMDEYKEKIVFPDPYAYYPLLMPISLSIEQ